MAASLVPTRMELMTLAACARSGDRKSAAHARGVSVSTVSRQLVDAYRKLDVGKLVEALAALGWLVVPPDEELLG